MDPLKNDITTTIHDIRNTIYYLCKYAEDNQTIEHPLYGMLDTVLNLLRSTISTEGGRSIACFPQFRLISSARWAENLTIDQFMTVIPDFALLLNRQENQPTTVVVPLIMEVKRLLPNPMIADGSLVWFSDDGSTASEIPLLHQKNITQILAQGFCAMNAYPKQNVFHLLFVVGIYFSHFIFTRPASLPDVPMLKSIPDAEKPAYVRGCIKELFPPSCVKIVHANKCIFNLPTDPGELRLSAEFLSALYDCLDTIPAEDATVNTKQYRFFGIPKNEAGGSRVTSDPQTPPTPAGNELDIRVEAAFAKFFAQPKDATAPSTPIAADNINRRPPTDSPGFLESYRPDYYESPRKSPQPNEELFGTNRIDPEEGDGDYEQPAGSQSDGSTSDSPKTRKRNKSSRRTTTNKESNENDDDSSATLESGSENGSSSVTLESGSDSGSSLTDSLEFLRNDKGSRGNPQMLSAPAGSTKRAHNLEFLRNDKGSRRNPQMLSAPAGSTKRAHNLTRSGQASTSGGKAPELFSSPEAEHHTTRQRELKKRNNSGKDVDKDVKGKGKQRQQQR